MYLKSLEVQGFKSFPDKTLIRFGDDITAIVGPNGSGKSNISDAILWVMGEQSTKTLRGAKMEDVIFGGTQKRSAVGFAEATLTLDNTDRALAYDADEVMVTRRYYRSGDSEFYINKQSARLRDIHEMFMDTGLGREGYSNIGQGRIDEILSLKSGDRREIFEEAAGISKYRHRKEETERKLAHTEDNLLRIGDKVSELELQLDPLRKQSEKAKQYLEMKDELQGIEVAVWLEALERLSAAAKKAEADHAASSSALTRAHEELDSLYNKTDLLSQELRHRDGQLETVRVERNMLEAAHQQMEGQMSVLLSNQENNNANIRRFEEEVSDQTGRSESLVNQIAQAESRIREIGETLRNNQETQNNAQAELSAITQGAQGRTRQFLQLRGRQNTLTAEIAAAEAELHALEESLRQSGLRLEELEEDINAGLGRQKDTGIALEACRNTLNKAKEQVSTAKNVISGYGLRRDSRQKRREALAEELREVSRQSDAVEAKLRVFRAMERDYENYQKSVKLVMREAERGGLKNVHGPVSRLVRTEDEYTVAMEIALGGALQQIVVDAESDGKAAIGFLKRTGGGRAPFLPLSSVTGRTLREDGLEQCRGFVGIASELCKFDPRYRGIVENLLGRTVIAENIDCAIAMARQYRNRFKIVTLDGQVMNPGGSMTGGSVNKESGMLSRANELEKLEVQYGKLSQKKQETQSLLSEAQRLAQEVEYQIAAASEELRGAEDQVLRLQGQERQYEMLLQVVQEAADASRREQETLRSRQETDRRRLGELQGKLQVYRMSMTETTASLAELEGAESETAARTGALTGEITRLKTENAALEAERDTARAHIADLEKLRLSLDWDRKQKEEAVEAARQENLRLEGEITALKTRQEENRREADAARVRLEDVMSRRAATEAAKTKAERESQEKNQDILTMERACALLEQKKLTAQMEEKQIIDMLWDIYGLTPGTAPAKRGNIESVAAGNRRIAELKRKISALGTPNLGAIEEYARVNERYTYLASQRDDVLTSKRELESIIKNIQTEMTTIFVEEFGKIDHYFGKTFEEMFGGGKGQLILEDPQNPLTCGIEIRVQPPGKQVKTITLLSGGEKAFVAIALYFAILKVRPTPFVVMDEIEAALDDSNVVRFARYMRNMAEKTQFIVITHRRGTMEEADVLYGVTMQEQGISRMLTINLNDVERELNIR